MSYNRKIKSSIPAIVSVLLLCTNCSKTVQKESGVASIENLYASGMEKLKKNDLKGAEGDFQSIIKRDRNSPLGYTGIALIALKRSDFKPSLFAINRALQLDPDFADAYIVQGRIFTILKKSTWFQDAAASFNRAIALDPGSDRALYYYGELYLASYMFGRAEEYYDRAMKLQGSYKDSAAAKLTFIRKITEVAPVSRVGKIHVVDGAIDRAELCTLLIEELKIKELLEQYNMPLFEQFYTLDFRLKKDKIYIPADVTSHPRKQWIIDIVPLRIPDLSMLPDDKFYPDRTVTRAQLAVISNAIQHLLRGDKNESENSIEEEPFISDVRADFYAFDAIVYCVASGIMQTGDSGTFHPNDTVSGLDTIRILRKLRLMFE